MSSRVGKLKKFKRNKFESERRAQDENNNLMEEISLEGKQSSLEDHEHRVTKLMEKIRLLNFHKKEAEKKMAKSLAEELAQKKDAEAMLLHFQDFEKHLLVVETGLITIQCLPDELRDVDEIINIEKAAVAGYQLCMYIWKIKRKEVNRAIRKYKKANVANERTGMMLDETDLMLNDIKKQLEGEMREMGSQLKAAKGRGNLDLNELAKLLNELDVHPEDLANFVLTQDSD